MFSWPLVRFTLTAIRRDRIVQLLIILMALGTGVSSFLGSASATEEQAFTIAAAGTILRVMAVLGMIVFISFFLRRAFDSREVDYLLATPITRIKLLGSFAVAFTLLALLLTAVIATIMAVLAHHITAGWLLWTASVAVELIITAMLSLFFACVLRSATISTLCSLGYYSLARMMGLMIGIIESKITENTPIMYMVDGFVQFLSVITPRFDLVAQSAWLVYGDAGGLNPLILLLQLVVFSFLFFVCAAFDLRRVQF